MTAKIDMDDAAAAQEWRLGQARAAMALLVLTKAQGQGLGPREQVQHLALQFHLSPEEAAAAREALSRWPGGQLPYLPEGSGEWRLSPDG